MEQALRVETNEECGKSVCKHVRTSKAVSGVVCEKDGRKAVMVLRQGMLYENVVSD